MWRPLKHCGYWTLAKLMSGFASRLPLSASWKIGDYIGELVFHQASVSRNRAKRQIIQALPSVSNVEHLALKCFQNLGKNLMEFLHFQQTEWVDTAVRLEGQRNLDQALSLERGVIVLMGHFGNWELVGATFARHGYKLNAIARPIRSKTINNLVVGNRRQAGYDSLDREKRKSINIAVDKINAIMGKNKVKLAVQGNGRKWKLRQEKLSPCYTTRFSDILEVVI